MAFGLSFGAKKQKTSQTSTVDKTDVTNQQQSGTQSSTGTNTSSSTGSQSGSTVGQQTTSQTGTNTTTGQQTGTTTQTTNAFSDSTLGAIERAVQDLFGKVGGTAPVSAFDPTRFVEEGLAAVKNDVNTGLEADVNNLVTNVGGAATNNSMAAILSNRLRADAAAKVSGASANLTAQAEDIVRNNALATSQIAGQDQGFLNNLLAVLKGGSVTTTGTESTTTAQNQQTQNTGTANTSEQNQQQTSQQQVQTQQLIEMMSQLLSGTTNTKGTETTKGNTSQMGGGFSLGF